MARAVRHVPCLLTLVALALAPTACGGGGGTDADGGATDAPRADTNVDSGAGCSVDADCADGLYCNGDERCASGTCVAGTAPSCADAIACTHDFCSEATRACLHELPDVDGDGHGDAACTDATGVALGDDCADDDANRFPGNPELCDAAMHDEDCVDTTFGHVDQDSDGFEDHACCNGTRCGTDCDDSNRSVNTGATEACNHVDDDCDGHVDEMLGAPMYPDADRDGWGDSSMAQVTQCGDTVGFAAEGGDCDDDDVARNPGQLEVCDTVDNDCDTSVDEDAGALPWYVDADADGYGDPAGATLTQCAPPTGSYSLVGTDCDDTTNARSPRVAEICNGIDDDCNGRADFAITPGDLEDDDRDRIADVGCGGTVGRDCNDRDAGALPGAVELCNGRDDDCDTHVDEDATSGTFHRDADTDGYGDPGTSVIACFAPTGYVLDASDCDDGAPMRHPGGVETCNATDDDCDHTVDEAPSGASCTIPHAVAACTVGICHVDSCQSGYSDCTLASGCETATAADVSHCGDCATACATPYEQCASSHCEPSTFDPMIASVAGVSPRDEVGTAVAADGTKVVLGGWFSGTSFGIGCGTVLDAQGRAAILSVRGLDGACQATLAIDGSGDEAITDVGIDHSGTVYAVLTTSSSTLSVGSIAVNAAAGQGGHDIVVVALDATLVPQWARRFGGAVDDRSTSLMVATNDLWVVGALQGPATIGTTMLGASTTPDPLVVHLAFNGTILHAVTAVTTGVDAALGVTVGSGVFVVGTLAGSGSFGPVMLSASGPTDAFLWTLAESDAGTASAVRFGGTGNDDARAITTNTGAPGASMVIAGTFDGTFGFDTFSLTSAGMTDGYLVGINLVGNVLWSLQFGGPGADTLDDVAEVAGVELLAVGSFTGTAIVGTGTANVTSRGGTDGVVLPVSPNGSPSFPDSFGGSGRDQLLGVATSPSNPAYLAGAFTGDVVWSEGLLRGVGGLDACWLSTYAPLP